MTTDLDAEYADAFAHAAAESARLGIALARWKDALDRLGAATAARRTRDTDTTATAQDAARRLVHTVMAAEGLPTP